MGFDAGFTKYPKYKDTTPNEILGLESYFSYDTSDWAKEHFSDKKDYVVYNNYPMPSQELIDFYKSFVHKDEYGYTTISDSLCSWCSNGIWLYEEIDNLFDMSNGVVVLNREDIIKLLLTTLNRLDGFNIDVASINQAFVSEYDEDSDETIITTRKCDGVELEFDDDTFKRIYTASEYEGEFVTFKSNASVDEIYSVFYTIRKLKQILEETDFENYTVYYSGGW